MTEITDGTYTAAELEKMGGHRAWSPHIPTQEGRARDEIRGELISHAIQQIQDYQDFTGLLGVALFQNGEIVAIFEAE